MPKKNVKVQDTKPKLRVVRETTAYNDIVLKDWRNYKHIETGTLWNFQSRDNTNGHSYDYHGNYIPQIATQLFERYTKSGDVILDMFLGSGTSAIEAVNMKRRCIGVELKQEQVDNVTMRPVCTLEHVSIFPASHYVVAQEKLLNHSLRFLSFLEFLPNKKGYSVYILLSQNVLYTVFYALST